MRILVTGGSGFLAAFMMRRFLRRGATFRVLDLRAGSPLAARLLGDDYGAIEWVEGDVADAHTVAAAAEGTNLIIHLAALLTPACQADPVRGAAVNLTGTLHVFANAVRLGHTQVLYMSSAGVFGPDDGTTPRPTTHYGAYKLATEGAARAEYDSNGLSSTGFRPLIVYGPGREVGLTAGPSIACREAARGAPYTIGFSGNSDFVYVDDVAAAFELAWASPREGAQVYNVTGEHAPVASVCQTVNEIAGERLIDYSGEPIPVAGLIDEGALRSDYPDMPRTPLAAGLAETYEFYARARASD
ncbi:MAG: SDR family oxidoreductase [Pseudomonadota bacterium]